MVVKSVTLPAAWAMRERRPGLIVLIYHRVGAGQHREMDLPFDRFREQIGWLRGRFHVVDLLEGLDRVAAQEPLERDLVAVTFDDGYAEVAERAWPVLREFQIPFTIFAATGFIDAGASAPIRAGGAAHGAPPRPLTWEQLLEMQGTGLARIGSHTRTHRDFDEITAEEAEADVVDAADTIEQRCGTRPELFAYPRAVVAHESIVARHHRYALAGGGAKNVPGEVDPMQVTRTPVRASDGSFFFRRRLDAIAPLEDRLYDRLRGHRGEH